MNEKERRDAKMLINRDAPSCSRADDLIGYLYSEAGEAQAKDFEQHMAWCASCRDELAAFGHVRASIGEWRDQSLGSMASSISVVDSAPLLVPAKATQTRTRSALAALREFFALSPMWLRGATAFASVLFCALAAIAIFYFYEQPRRSAERASNRQMYTEDQVRVIVEERLKQERIALASNPPVPAPAVLRAGGNSNDEAANNPPQRITVKSSRSNTRDSAQRRVTPSLSLRERQELAEVLQIGETKDEEELPSLSDLLGESN